MEKVSGTDGVINIHGQIAADAQDGKFEFGCFADEFHIQREGGVAGVIKISIRRLDHETAGIQRPRILDAVFTEPGNHFKIGNHSATRARAATETLMALPLLAHVGGNRNREAAPKRE